VPDLAGALDEEGRRRVLSERAVVGEICVG